MPVHITPLSPLAFLERSASVFPERTAAVDAGRRLTYAGLAAEATRAAHALRASGVGPGDRVAYLCPNARELLVAHFAAPLAGAVLVAINTRLAPEEVRAICAHSGARLLVADAELERHGRAGDRPPRPGRRGGLGRRRPRRIAAGAGLRGLPRARLRRAPAVDGGGRGRDDLDQLHVRHDRGAQGRHVHAPRAPTSTPWARTSRPATGPARSTSGRCRCSTATAGATPGPSSRPEAPRCACGPCAATRSGA